MKKVLLILIPLIVLGGGGYWYFTKDTTTDKSLVQKMSGNEEQTYSGNLKDIVSLGKSLKCTWSNETAEGTSWIKGDKVYTQVSTSEGTSNIIFKDNCTWSWTSGSSSEATGIKFCFESGDTEDIESTEADLEKYAESLENQDLDDSVADVNYNCRPAVISDSKFNPPSDINFSSWEELMQGNLEDFDLEDFDY